MIINQDHPKYREKWNRIGKGRFNGAFYYSKEICKYIIPLVKTDRNWITINIKGIGCDHAIVFIHNNLRPDHYDWLKNYNDLVLVCGVPETCAKVAHLGQPIYLPLSIHVDEVKKYRCEKTKQVAYVGRKHKRQGITFPIETQFIEGLPRTRFLKEVAKYKQVYAVGRSAIEAKVLGCEILSYDERFPDPSRWKVVDCSEAAEMLQRQLDMIDGV